MIKISKLAQSKIKEMITNNKGKAAYLYLQGGGCNGFSYKFKVLNDDKKPNKLDEIVDVDGDKLILCNKSMLFLLGTKINYIEDLMGSRFDFENEKIESKCGCGTSFNFKDL